jgi:putative transposase
MGVRAALSPDSVTARQTQDTSIAPHSGGHLLCLARLPARGAISRPIFLPGRQCFTITGVSAIPGTWHLLYTALHRAERERVGRHPDPSAAIMDSQSVKTVEESAHIRGYDAHKCVKGRKRHLLVDTLGLPIAWYVTPADLSDPQGARRLLGGLVFFVPRRKQDLGGCGLSRQRVGRLVPAAGHWLDLEPVPRSPGPHGFQVQPRRWVVENTQSQYP